MNIMLHRGNELIDALSLHCLLTMELWHRIFSDARMECIPSCIIFNMIVIAFKCFGNSIRGKAVWKIRCLSLCCGLCGKRGMPEFFRTLRASGICFIFFVSFWHTVQIYLNLIL